MISYIEKKLEILFEKESNLLILLGLMIISEFYFMYKQIGPFPPRNYLALALSAGILVYEKFSYKKLVTKNQMILGFVLLSFFAKIASTIINDPSIEYFKVCKYLLKFAPLCFSLQYLAGKVDSEKLAKLTIILFLPSFVIALGQAFQIGLFWDIRQWYDEDTFIELVKGYYRPAGLAYYTLTLAEQFFLVIPLTLFLFDRTKKKVYLLLDIVFMLCIVLSTNRGSLLGAFIAHFVYLFYISKRLMFTFFAVTTSLYLIFHPYIRFLKFEFKNDGGRIHVALGALRLWLDNVLFGVGLSGYADFLNIVKKYLVPIENIGGFEDAHQLYPHNYFLNILVEQGLMGITVIILFLFFCFKIILSLKDKMVKYLMIMYLVPIMINSLFHNAGFFNSSTVCFSLIIIFSFCFKGHKVSG